jgi:HK97 gp10 family phage protein
MAKKVVIEGMDELKMKVKGISRRVAINLESAMLAGAAVVEKEADALAPDPKIEKETQEKSPSRVAVAVGPEKEKWFWRFFETGATAHEIKARKAKALLFEGRNGFMLASSVDHTGMGARPFLRPAFDSKKDEAVRVIGSILKAEIEREASG